MLQFCSYARRIFAGLGHSECKKIQRSVWAKVLHPPGRAIRDDLHAKKSSNDLRVVLQIFSRTSHLVSLSQTFRLFVGVVITQPVDTTQLQELKKGSSLIEAPNIDNKPNTQKLQKMIEDITDIKERNKQIFKAIEQGYSQHMIAKVLGISQQAVGGVVKRSRK